MTKGIALSALCVLYLAIAPVHGENPAASFSPAAVDAAVDKAIEYLWSRQTQAGTWVPYGTDPDEDNYHPLGPTALAAYALQEAGIRPDNPRLVKAFKALDQPGVNRTYSLGLRAQVWRNARTFDGRFEQLLKPDVAAMLKGQKNGSYSYRMYDPNVLDPRRKSYDNSNSQYGVLGVWAGADAGLPIPTRYWMEVARHWLTCQQRDGGWAYQSSGRSTATMTTAGLATLYLCHDELLIDGRLDRKVSQAIERSISRGMAWMAKHFEASLQRERVWFAYYLYGVERVALASGHKFFGKADWYRLGAADLLRTQREDGSWRPGEPTVPPEVSTSYALIFLARGRMPVALNKLQYRGDWNPHPRDLAMLVKVRDQAMENLSVWQVVNLRTEPEQWHDAPVLLISGRRTPSFTSGDLAKLRRYVHQGGLILSVAVKGGTSFDRGMRMVYEKLWPDRPLEALPTDHPIYNGQVKRANGQPKLWAVDNGARVLALHTNDDLCGAWQNEGGRRDRPLSTWPAGMFGMNLVQFATDKAAPKPRGADHWPAAEKEPAEARTVRLVRVRYDGNWDPEPLAFERFGRLAAKEGALDVQILPAAKADALVESDANVAWLTGTDELTLSDAELSGLRSFVEGGGTLVVDAAGGAEPGPSEAFATSASTALNDLWPDAKLATLPAESPLYNDKKSPLPGRLYRRTSRLKFKDINRPLLKAIVLGDRPAVIFSAEDLTCGLAGANQLGLHGYKPDAACALVRSIITMNKEQ